MTGEIIINILTVNERKYKKILRKYAKINKKNTGSFCKFCYVISVIIKIISVIMAVLTLNYVFNISGEYIDLAYLFIFALFPYLFSLIPDAVWYNNSIKEFVSRKEEEIILNDNGFVYMHRDLKLGFGLNRICYNVLNINIDEYLYDEKIQLLTLKGKFPTEIYVSNELKQSVIYNEITIFNVFNIDLLDIIAKK